MQLKLTYVAQMTEWLVYNELKKIWKEAVIHYLRHYPDICLQGLKNRDVNTGPPEYTKQGC